ncbi:MAG: carboxypeptidase regulatory-like domain-containing protein [Acidobacteria bacterium]|nr:carboxypeptidase regulatory-like domain-containing protein [Acidobacteriota bacterium]
MRTALLLLACCAVRAQYGPCTAEGTVTREGDGAPIPRARIFFNAPARLRTVVLGFISDDQGRFTATALDPTAYSIAVQKPGLLASSHSAARADLSRDCHKTGLALKLTPAAILSGRISVPPGSTPEGSRVEVLKRIWMGGRWQFRPAAAGTSGEGGEYRISNVPAGSYLLRAQPPASSSFSFRSAGGPELFVSPSYYPGVLSPAQARNIAVDAGAELAGLDFALLSTPLYRVSGKILSSEGLKAPAWCTVLLRSNPPGLQHEARYQASDGTFSFPTVAPGEYDLLAVSAESTNFGSAARRIVINNGDLESLDIALEPPVPVLFKAILPNSAASGSGIEVSLRPLSSRTLDQEPVALPSNGKVKLFAFVRERYRIELKTKQSNLYLRSVLAAGRPLPSFVVDYSRPDAPDELTLEIAADGAVIEGTASGLSGISRCFAVLVPSDLSRLADAALLTTPISIDGRFRFTSVPPGDYLVYAFFQPLSDAFDLQPMLQEPGWVPTFKGLPLTVTAAPGSTVRIQLNAQPAP